MRARCWIPVLLCALAGCTATELVPAERLDPKTAVHTMLMAEPWVYGLDAPMLAAHARDYLNLGVLQTNRAGTRADWLGVIAWSTIDRSALPDRPSLVQPRRIRLTWKTGSLELSPVARGRTAVGLSEPAFADDAARFEEAWYPLSAAQLARLAEGPPDSVALVDGEGRTRTYAAWEARPEALLRFLEETGPRESADTTRR